MQECSVHFGSLQYPLLEKKKKKKTTDSQGVEGSEAEKEPKSWGVDDVGRGRELRHTETSEAGQVAEAGESWGRASCEGRRKLSEREAGESRGQRSERRPSDLLSPCRKDVGWPGESAEVDKNRGRARVLRPSDSRGVRTELGPSRSRGRRKQRPTVPRPRPTKAEAEEVSGSRASCWGRAEGTWVTGRECRGRRKERLSGSHRAEKRKSRPSKQESRPSGSWGRAGVLRPGESRGLRPELGPSRSRGRRKQGPSGSWGRTGVEADEKKTVTVCPSPDPGRGRRPCGAVGRLSTWPKLEAEVVDGAGKLARGQSPRRKCAVASSSSIEMSGVDEDARAVEAPTSGVTNVEVTIFTSNVHNKCWLIREAEILIAIGKRREQREMSSHLGTRNVNSYWNVKRIFRALSLRAWSHCGKFFRLSSNRAAFRDRRQGYCRGMRPILVAAARIDNLPGEADYRFCVKLHQVASSLEEQLQSGENRGERICRGVFSVRCSVIADEDKCSGTCGAYIFCFPLRTGKF